MRRVIGVLGVIGLGLGWAAPARAADDGAFDGQWRTSLGIVKLTQEGDAVTGTYGDAGQFRLKGTVKGRVLTFEYEEGQAKGDARFTLDETANAFRGGFQVRGGNAGRWDGWRPDPKAPEAKQRGDSGGLWLTDLGLLELEQHGAKVKGRYALRGTSVIEGEMTGRRLEFRFQSFQKGKGWFDLAEDSRTLAGAANTTGFPGWFGWKGRRAPEYARHARLVPGKVVDGSTRGLLTYAVRAPDGFEEGVGKQWPAVLILHGSNMNARAYVGTIAAAWPDIAREYILLGINGETPSDIGTDPRFNYTYVNFVGKSKYKGFPGTDRESPALVSEAMAELKEVYPIRSYLVGGHSQGGFLTYSLLMNYPEAIAGAFPVSCGVIFQCEPAAYDDAAARAAQRRVPLAIVHGTNDPVVDYGMGRYAAELFGEAGWPAFRHFTDEKAGHLFARLPVGDAIRWLGALSSDDPARLLDFAEASLKAGRERDAIAALRRARSLTLDKGQQARLDRVGRQVDDRAAAGAKKYLPLIRENKDGSWIDGLLAYRDAFEFADAARDVDAAFQALRERHDGPAQKAFGEARAAFQRGQRDEGYAKYQEIVDRHYASPLYRSVKRWLAERK
jgi:predicted esterase